MLHCNVIVKQDDDGVEFAAVDSVASMQAADSKDLAKIVEEIKSKLKSVIENL
jgi:uncharacterized protein (DUF302 family)